MLHNNKRYALAIVPSLSQIQRNHHVVMEGSSKELMMGKNLGLTIDHQIMLGNLCGIKKLFISGVKVWRSIKVRALFALKELVAGITTEVQEDIVHQDNALWEAQNVSPFTLVNTTTHLQARLMPHSIFRDHAVFTFTHPEEVEAGRAAEAEEEKYNNDGSEGEEVRQHDKKQEDVQKEEEERNCRARRVYLGHLCLYPQRPPPPLAASPSRPFSQSPFFQHCSSTSRCSMLPFPVYFCWPGC